MPIVISRNLVVSEVQAYPANNPIIGWHNIVTTLNVTVDQEADGFPATNLANVDTSSDWRGTSAAEQTITVLTNYVDEIDYVGIGRHNFGTEGIVVSIWGRTEAGGDLIELVQEQLLADDSPVIFRFEPQSLYEVVINLDAGSAPPQAAVLYVGKLLVMQRPIWTGHTPIKYARVSHVVNGMAESGDFLGRIIIGEHRETAAQFNNIRSSFYREEVDPFLVAAQEYPFFWAAQPECFPQECGFVALINNPMPAPSPHHMSFELVMRGIP